MSLKQPFKVIAMHDICAYGRSSLTAILPILSVLNIQVCPLPGALLSSHFGFTTHPSFLNLSSELKKIIPLWKQEKFEFDGFYSGYLVDPEQVDIALEYIQEFHPSWVYIDPVLGDEGSLYPGLTVEHISAMIRLVSKAKVISPNITEACFLLGEKPESNISIEKGKKMLLKLAELGPQYVSITGLFNKEQETVSVLSFDKLENQYYQTITPCLTNQSSVWFHGTGDSFASVVLGNLMHGVPFINAINRAMTYVHESLKLSVIFQTEICLEPTLGVLFNAEQNAHVQII